MATESSIRGGFPQKESVLQHAFNDDEPFNLYPFWFQQQLYKLRVGLIKIEKKRGFFFSHIYARRVLYASRVSKSESVRIKKRTDEFLQISFNFMSDSFEFVLLSTFLLTMLPLRSNL